MINIKIGNKVYDVCKCPRCGKDRVDVSKYLDITEMRIFARLLCYSCNEWIYVEDAVGTPWVKESEG